MNHSVKETFKKLLTAKEQWISEHPDVKCSGFKYMNGQDGSMWMWEVNHATPDFAMNIIRPDGTEGVAVMRIFFDHIEVSYYSDIFDFHDEETKDYAEIQEEETRQFMEYCQEHFDDNDIWDTEVSEKDFED